MSEYLTGFNQTTVNNFKLNESSEKLIHLIRNNPKTTAVEIALELNISSRAAQKHLANLKTLGIIKRIGSDKTGFWETIGL